MQIALASPNRVRMSIWDVLTMDASRASTSQFVLGSPIDLPGRGFIGLAGLETTFPKGARSRLKDP